uniref:BCL-11A-like CCHC zinc finger domain-containing protein n=1 Tax=Glossina palpalis gambiensis TaxID=67801 RepID=A0A1B0BKD6_9MUSC
MHILYAWNVYLRIKHSDSTDADVTAQDILTCGMCQKAFALADIVKFIQHKVLQCNKENYGQCSNQAPTNDRADGEDGRPLGLANRRPSISSGPITSRKPSAGGSRIHTPPPSPADMLADGASSTPKRLVDENDNTTPKEMEASASREENIKISDNNEDIPKTLATIKQERIEDAESENIEDCYNDNNNNSNENDDGQPATKRPKIEFADAESNTLQTDVQSVDECGVGGDSSGSHRGTGSGSRNGSGCVYLFLLLMFFIFVPNSVFIIKALKKSNSSFDKRHYCLHTIVKSAGKCQSRQANPPLHAYTTESTR